MLSIANSPCCIVEKVSNVALCDCVGNVNFNCVEHCHDCLMHSLKYCIFLWILDSGWLMLQAIWLTKDLKVKFELTSIVLDNVFAEWVMDKPGPVHYASYCS